MVNLQKNGAAAFRVTLFVCLVATTVLTGCSGRPAPVAVPAVDPEVAAEGALAMYDADGDGKLTSKEIEASPPLKAALQSMDANRDKAIDKDELVERFSMWAKSGLGASSFACKVTYKGRPLAGAKVEFIPEEYFKNTFQPATGTTTRKGIASMAIDSSFLPDDLQRLRVIHQGLYRVVITHPSIEIPAAYNTDTELGLEVSFGSGRDFVPFKL